MTPPRPKQSLAVDLRDDLLRFIQQKFYPDSFCPAADACDPNEAKTFAQDRKRLIAWVILEPARFMNGKGFTVPADRYKQIVTSILLDALRHGNTSKIGYLPGWLKHVIQTHFNCHWEEYSDEAKAIAAKADYAIAVLGKIPVRKESPDAVSELATAANLLKRSKPAKKAGPKPSANLEFKL